MLLSVLTITLVVATALRFAKLGVRDFWFDESCTYIYVHNLFDWPADSNLLVESTNLPYYFVLRGWAALFGESEAGYRSLSALVATMSVALLAWFAWRLRGAWAGLCCGVLAAVHPLHVYYAREARAYSLWVFVLSLSLVPLCEACRRDRRRWWMAFGAVLLLCLHLHYYTVYWAAASVAVVGVAENPRKPLRAWAVTIGIVVVLFTPYFFAAVVPAAAGSGNKWIAKDFEGISAIPHSLWAMMPAGAYPPHLRGLALGSPDTLVHQPVWLAAGARIVPAALVLMVMLLVARALFAVARTQESADSARTEVRGAPGSNDRAAWPDPRRLHLFLAAMTLGPLLLAWVYSMLIRPNYLVGRYDLVAWPALMVWIGVLLADLPNSRLRVLALTILVACSAVPLHRMLAAEPPPSLHHQRAERLAEITGEGDLVVAFSYDRDYLQYYLHRAGFRGTIRSFPTWLEAHVGWVDTEADLQRLGEARKDAQELVAAIRERLSAGHGVYLLGDSTDPEGKGPRRAITGLLLRALQDAGLDMQPVDDRYLVFKLQPL